MIHQKLHQRLRICSSTRTLVISLYWHSQWAQQMHHQCCSSASSGTQTFMVIQLHMPHMDMECFTRLPCWPLAVIIYASNRHLVLSIMMIVLSGRGRFLGSITSGCHGSLCLMLLAYPEGSAAALSRSLHCWTGIM